MSRVSVSITVPGRISGAEELWYDTARWINFVDGFQRVAERDTEWPGGGRLIWDSTPHGRGRVVERVQRHEPRVGQTSEIEDARLSGTQTVSFEPEADDTRVTLTLDYAIKESRGFTPLVDLFFVRRAVRDALRRTLRRFAAERRGDIELGA